ncbi:MAG: hypothetical protein HQL77_10300 [Magnetococcales bacterium]|nr:hypothetical protein [Magnetococcales bacterium]
MGDTIAFDTHAYVKKLREAGVDERQAEVQAEALVGLVEDRLATKRDIAELKRDINSTLSHFQFGVCGLWIPAFAGMTVTFFQRIFCFVIPAKAGIQNVYSNVTK